MACFTITSVETANACLYLLRTLTESKLQNCGQQPAVRISYGRCSAARVHTNTKKKKKIKIKQKERNVSTCLERKEHQNHCFCCNSGPDFKGKMEKCLIFMGECGDDNFTHPPVRMWSGNSFPRNRVTSVEVSEQTVIGT